MQTPDTTPRPPAWKKLLGWTLVGLFSACMLSLVGMGVMAIYQGISCTCFSRGSRAGLFGLGVLALLVPGMLAFVLLRRRWKTGTFKLSPEERAAALAKCRAARSQSPLWSRVLNGVLWPLLAVFWTVRAVHRPSLYTWSIAGIYIFTGVLWIWQAFKPPVCKLPDEPMRDSSALN